MNGIILINKEKGITSFGVVSKMRRIFNTKKVGHCGTLDPNATGVLPILIGNATKLSKYLVEHDKEYIATVKFGIKTDSGDEEGNVISEDEFRLENTSEDFYISKLNELVGTREQIPPMYSAVKVDGKRLYEYAREGRIVEREPRKITIYSISMIKLDYENNELTFRVVCSKGTYIRTLCEELAEKIGTVGYMKELERTKLDKFDIENSVIISELENCEDKEKYLISVEDLFINNEKVDLTSRKKELFLNGVKLTFNLANGLYRVYSDGLFIGIGVVERNLLKRDVIMDSLKINHNI